MAIVNKEGKMAYIIETDDYIANKTRYDLMEYRRCGRSGLKLPLISLGLWHNFSGYSFFENSRKVVRKAFDLGITHFDLANNYGPPQGAAEENFGRILKKDFHLYRDEIIVSTKAGYYMWPGPYGEWGSRKYLISSLNQSLTRLGLDYVDIFYSHRYDPETPLEETMGALAQVVKQGKALYVGISSYGPQKTLEALKILSSLKVPCLIHQSSYSMLNRWIEKELIKILNENGVGMIGFSPLAQGLLTDKYINGIPIDSRGSKNTTLLPEFLSETNLYNIAQLNKIALERGQTLSQMAISWCLRKEGVVSVVSGASSPDQLEQNVKAINNLDFTQAELEMIDEYAKDGGINLWAKSSDYG